MASSGKAVSAPGKVLLAGGYLVLDREYTGLVFGLNARIHVVIKPLKTSSGVSLSEIIVNSPQFLEAQWEYGYRLTEMNGGIEVTQLRVSASNPVLRNPFIETALGYTLTYIASHHHSIIAPSSITILADNDYYSTPGSAPSTSTSTSSNNTPRFHNFAVPLRSAHKTGLGSSAALVTAFTAALLVHYLPADIFSLSTPTGRRRLHNLAQAAHCAAQGKVGSGFDVASAVYGSCLYRRFSPSVLAAHGEPSNPSFQKQIKRLVEETEEGDRWDTEIEKKAVKIPKGVRLVMIDVDCGSQTPGMVKKVLAWRKEKPEEAKRIWDELGRANEALAKELVRLADGEEDGFEQLKKCFGDIRRLIQEMSAKSEVPIEPQEQTELLDALAGVPGVIGGVVPGAGGYDAVALLIEDKPDVVAHLNEFLQKLNAAGGTIDGGKSKIGKLGMLRVREDMEGARVEDASLYDNWTT